MKQFFWLVKLGVCAGLLPQTTCHHLLALHLAHLTKPETIPHFEPALARKPRKICQAFFAARLEPDPLPEPLQSHVAPRETRPPHPGKP